MKLYNAVAGMAVVALTMGAATVARADGDPISKIVVPTDPSIIVPCSEISDAVCFTETNSISNPADINGPTAAEIGNNPLFDITTDFFYEPDNCSPSGDPSTCPGSDVLDQVYLAIVPTIPSTAYPCFIGAGPGDATPAFNGCSPIAETPDSDLILELTCDPSKSACTGMLPGQEGSAEITPEPGELALLGLGIPLVGLYGWRRRNVVGLACESRPS